MKKYISTYFFVILILTFTSCEKYLDLDPISQGIALDNQSTDSVVFTSADQVESALSGLYSEFRNEYWELDYFVNGDAQSDDAYAGADNPANFQIDNMNINAVNSNVSRDWAYLYSAIGKANVIINNVDSVTDENLSAERKAEIKGEASFIRAFHYFQLVQLWGGVPLQLIEVREISAELLPQIYPQLYPARNTEEEVYSQIILDLETALNSVPVSAPNKGYVTKGAVNAMLAKVYATKQPHEYDKVIQYCDAVINGPYNLLPDYEQLWNNTVENSDESIFEINYEGTSESGNWGTSMFMWNRISDWKKFNTPSNDLVNAFLEEGDEIRLASSISFEDISGNWTDSYWPENNYPFAYKYRDVTDPSPQNYIFLRLADIILLKAEALNETGDVTGAGELVNMIRSRVDLPNTDASNQEDMRLAIEKERRLELAFEGHRWYDLKRTGRALEVMSNVKGPNGDPLNYPVSEQRLLWPIPQGEMDLNENLIQNPGY